MLRTLSASTSSHALLQATTNTHSKLLTSMDVAAMEDVLGPLAAIAVVRHLTLLFHQFLSL